MSDNVISFSLKLQDYLTNNLVKASTAATAVGNAFEKTQEQIGNYNLEANRYARYISSSVQKTTTQIAATSAAIAPKTLSAGARIRQGFSNAYQSAQVLGSSITELKAKLASVNEVKAGTVLKSEFQQANNEASKLEKQIRRLESGGSRLRGYFSSALSQIPGGQLLSNPVAIAGAALIGSVKKGMEQQKNRIIFETLSSNKQTGDKLFNNLQQFSTVAPYAQKDILGQSQALLSYGVTAKKILPDLKMLGDIAGGNNEHFKRLGLAFGEVKSLGHLAGRQLRQFAALGLNPLTALSKMTGLSMETLTKRMEKGAITFDMVTKAMAFATGPGGRFHNMMKNINDTFSGQLHMSLNRLGLLMARIGEAILPVLTFALKAFNAAFGWIVDHKGLILSALIAISAGLLAANIEAIAGAVGFGIYSTVVNIATGAMKLFNLVVSANPIGFVIALVIGLVLWFTHLWKTSEKFRATIMGVFAVMKLFANMIKDLVIGRIKELLSGIAGVGKAIAQLFTGKFSAAWTTAKQAARDIAGIGTAQRVSSDVSAIRNGAISKAYQTGAEQGRKSFEASQKAKAATNPNTPSGAMAQGNNKLLAGQIMNGGGSGGSTGTDSISSKGPRNLTINLKSMIENLQIHTVTTQAGIREMEDNVKEALYRILNSANAIQTP